MNVSELNTLVLNIREKCALTLKQLVQLGKALKTDNDIVKQIQRRTVDTKEIIVEKVQSYLTKQTSDAKRFLDEYETFFSVTDRGFRPNQKCEFLYQIWKGDAYDTRGIEALRLLERDIEEQLKSIYSKSLVEKYPFGLSSNISEVHEGV